MSRIRYVMAGCGGFGSATLKSMVRHPDFELVALVDPLPEKVTAVRKLIGRPEVPGFDRLEDALARTKPELVFSFSPVSAHYDNCRVALEAGCNVAVAKPFTDTVEEAWKLVDLCRATKRFISVHQSSRFGHGAMIRRWIEEGLIGKPAFGNFYTYRDRMQGIGGYRLTESWPVINATSIHWIDAMRYWCADDFVRVSLRGVDAPWNPYRDPGVVTGWFEMKGGFVFGFFQSFISRVAVGEGHHPYEHYMIQGDRAALVWSGPWGRGPVQLLDPAESAPKTLTVPANSYPDEVLQYLDTLRDSVRSGGPVFCPAEDNIKSLAAIKAAELSAQRGGAPVEVARLLDRGN